VVFFMCKKTDQKFMRFALRLARLGAGSTGLNPRVGAVAVREQRVVGAGTHLAFGGPHAEGLLIGSTAPELLRGATLYVTLEPCSHQGKQPPCAPSVANAGFERVVVALIDPNPLVSGQGLEILQRGGLKVDLGVCAKDAASLNAPFLWSMKRKRAFVTLKMASGIDGRFAAADGSSQWITGPRARNLVHQWRRSSDAIVVGRGTFMADLPSLNVRLGEEPSEQMRRKLKARFQIDARSPKPPVRVVLDSECRCAEHLEHFCGDKAPKGGRWVIACNESAAERRIISLQEAGAECWLFPRQSGARGIPLPELFQKMAGSGLIDVMCEGGGSLATEMLKDNLVDRLRLFVAPILPSGDRLWVGDMGHQSLSSAPRRRLERVKIYDDDVLLESLSMDAASLLDQWQSEATKA